MVLCEFLKEKIYIKQGLKYQTLDMRKREDILFSIRIEIFKWD